MIFTAGQMIFLFVVTEILICGVLISALTTIRHCAMAKAYRYMVVAQNSTMVSYDDVEEAITSKYKNKKEEKKDGKGNAIEQC